MQASKATFSFVFAMCAVVAASNYLVQFPVEMMLSSVNLSEILTWGAFTYPIAFLVTDLTNRKFGPAKARFVVLAGFAFAVALSIQLATPRIAIASGTAFLVAQLLDISIFDRLRKSVWWKAPLISSLIGSLLDTILFWGIAFCSSIFSFGFRRRGRIAWLSGAVSGSRGAGGSLGIASYRRLFRQSIRRARNACALSSIRTHFVDSEYRQLDYLRNFCVKYLQHHA